MTRLTVSAGEWHEIKVALPVAADTKRIHLRLFLPAQKKPVEISRIQFFNANKPAREWNFDSQKK